MVFWPTCILITSCWLFLLLLFVCDWRITHISIFFRECFFFHIIVLVRMALTSKFCERIISLNWIENVRYNYFICIYSHWYSKYILVVLFHLCYSGLYYNVSYYFNIFSPIFSPSYCTRRTCTGVTIYVYKLVYKLLVITNESNSNMCNIYYSNISFISATRKWFITLKL